MLKPGSPNTNARQDKKEQEEEEGEEEEEKEVEGRGRRRRGREGGGGGGGGSPKKGRSDTWKWWRKWGYVRGGSGRKVILDILKRPTIVRGLSTCAKSKDMHREHGCSRNHKSGMGLLKSSGETSWTLIVARAATSSSFMWAWVVRQNLTLPYNHVGLP